jgi:elongation factor G
VADPFQGRVSYFKVMSGSVKNDGHLINGRSGIDERLSHIGVLFGKTLNPVNELRAGDIGAVAKLKDTLTGDTLFDKAAPINYPAVKVAEPSIAYAISAKTRNDEDRMGHAIQKILEEDPSLRFYRDPQTKEFLLGGNGQQHVEIICSRLKRRYGVDVELHAPKIPYRETIRGKADVQGRHKNRPADTGSSATAGSVWSPCLVAPNSNSPTRSSAARFPATSSRPSRKASSKRPSGATWRGTRWWTSR